MRIEQRTCRGWLALGCVGVLVSVTIACEGGAFPTAPSTTSVIEPGSSGSSNLATSAGGSGAANVGRGDGPSGRGGEEDEKDREP